MFERFIQYINKNNLLKKDDKVLLAVSGGIDSTVLLDLFSQCSNKIAIAHCNFNLRGKESIDDEKFVKELSKKYKTGYYSISFQTEQYAKEKGISVQMAARLLRYDWFEKIRSEKKFDKISAAHNRNDVIETFFINLSRGTGIKGLTGIDPLKGNVIRPLLFATRKEIETYSKEKNLAFREDSSNSSDKYLRNNIRHNVIPAFNEMNSAFEENMHKTMENLAEAEKIYDFFIENEKSQLLKEINGNCEIEISKLKSNPLAGTILFEILKPFGFSNKTLDDIMESFDSQSGKQFFSDYYTLTRDREKFIISKKNTPQYNVSEIQLGDNKISESLTIRISSVKSVDLKSSKKVIFADAAMLDFPLKLRKWKAGDRFKPFGMINFKKLSDFFIDNKITRPEKENIPVLVSSEEIVWLVGFRADNRFRVTPHTTEILKIELIN